MRSPVEQRRFFTHHRSIFMFLKISLRNWKEKFENAIFLFINWLNLHQTHTAYWCMKEPSSTQQSTQICNCYDVRLLCARHVMWKAQPSYACWYRLISRRYSRQLLHLTGCLRIPVGSKRLQHLKITNRIWWLKHIQVPFWILIYHPAWKLLPFNNCVIETRHLAN